MTATLTVCQEESRSAAEPNFLEMLPTIRRVASYAFRNLRRAVREDLMAEVVANAFAAFQRLVERGKAALAYPSALARFAIRQVRGGRRVGARLNGCDVLSPYAQHRNRFSVRQLFDQAPHAHWEELADGRRANPADIVCCRVDFRTWLSRLDRFKRRVALRLAAGDTTSEAAEHFRLSPGRVSQLRQELRSDWDAFQAVPAA